MTWTLAIDTSTYTQIVCLMQDETVRAHLQHEPPGNHGSQLLRTIDTLLKEHDLTVQELDLLVAGVGPGSFTGLRVGLAAVKGLALATNCPIVGVSTLEAIAYPIALSRPGDVITAAVDARKKEVYAGFYSWNSSANRLEHVVEEQAISPDALVELMQTHGTRVFAGFKTSKYRPLRAREEAPYVTLPEHFTIPGGVALARIGKQKFATSQASELATLEPNYIRPSDAEISLQKRTIAAAQAKSSATTS